jgi:hypothetical protein
VNQIISVEMGYLHSRSAVEQLTPDVTYPIGAHYKINCSSIRAPGERGSCSWRTLKDCESAGSVHLHDGEKRA